MSYFVSTYFSSCLLRMWGKALHIWRSKVATRVLVTRWDQVLDTDFVFEGIRPVVSLALNAIIHFACFVGPPIGSGQPFTKHTPTTPPTATPIPPTATTTSSVTVPQHSRITLTPNQSTSSQTTPIVQQMQRKRKSTSTTSTSSTSSTYSFKRNKPTKSWHTHHHIHTRTWSDHFFSYSSSITSHSTEPPLGKEGLGSTEECIYPIVCVVFYKVGPCPQSWSQQHTHKKIHLNSMPPTHYVFDTSLRPSLTDSTDANLPTPFTLLPLGHRHHRVLQYYIFFSIIFSTSTTRTAMTLVTPTCYNGVLTSPLPHDTSWEATCL